MAVSMLSRVRRVRFLLAAAWLPPLENSLLPSAVCTSFVSARTNKRHHHHETSVLPPLSFEGPSCIFAIRWGMTCTMAGMNFTMKAVKTLFSAPKDSNEV
jgi:hypothetical protein